MTATSDNSFFKADGLPEFGTTFTHPELIHESPGGFSRICRASRNGRMFALKALKPEYQESPLHIALLRKEYENAIGLVHAGIATVYSYEKVDRLGNCIVEEWIDGLTLDRYVAEKRPSTKALLDMLLKIADAIAYIHAHGIVHRDLKPDNIIVSLSGCQPKIIDFGLAYSPDIEIANGPGGTEGYAAPEQYTTDKPCDHRADIFAFGKILDTLNIFSHTAAVCTRPDPDDRPESMVEVKSLLLKEKLRPKRIMEALCAVTVCAALILTVLLIPDNADKKAGITATPPNVSSNVIPETTGDSAESAAKVAAESDRQAPASEHVSDSQSETSDTDVQPGPSDAGYSDRLSKEALNAAKVRFAAHIAMADTVKTSFGYRLYYIGYWRHLAKEDMRRWIERNPTPEGIYTDDAAAQSRSIIDKYSEAHSDQHLDGLRKIENRLGPHYVVVNSFVADELEDGSLVVYTLGEDNQWHRSIEEPKKKR